MVDFAPHGLGTLVYRDNDAFGRARYTGTFDKGVLAGNGTMKWANGAR